ncbi:MAG: DNA starvation/stationary phase protection protein Dps [Planctomycetota bacterium]
MYASPTPFSPEARAAISQALNTVLIDGLDLHSQIKVAHWNIKGPHFAALHPLFDTFATELAVHNDVIAERGVTLGGVAVGTARYVAQNSGLPELPAATTRDLELVELLAVRIETYLASARVGREVAHEHGDEEAVDLMTQVVQAFEKHAWFLRATLGR